MINIDAILSSSALASECHAIDVETFVVEGHVEDLGNGNGNGSYHANWDLHPNNLKRLDGLLTALERANAVNQEQQATIRTLSSPILRVWDGILMMPVFGAVDDGDQAAQMMEGLLDAVARSRSRYVIIDLTGANAVAPILGEQVTRLLQAVRLLGAQGIVVGIRPEMAQAMVSGGVSFAGIPTLASVYDALVLCIRCLREDSLGAR